MVDVRESPWNWGWFESAPPGGTQTISLFTDTSSATGTASISDGAWLADASTSPSEATEIAFINGITASGTVAATSFRTWTGTDPARYSATTSSEFKWGTTTAGTSGGTIYYYFAPSSDWTSAEQAVFTSAFALWSAEANVTFVATTNASQANVTLIRGSNGEAYTSIADSSSTVGSSTIAPPSSTGNYVSIDTSVAGFGLADALSAYGGYGMMTVVHELGHVLGLGHAGPYNGNVDSPTQQYSAYDTRLWSIMSYIDPSDTSAKYYSSSSTTAQATDWTTGGVTYYPSTPMMLDILAIQELYGAATTGQLTTGETFGFSCTITGSLETFFNFTINTNPVVTIWDSASGNTLNLSGYGSGSTIDLIPGSFSSCDGMVNNLGIATGTWIDTAIGGSGNDTFITNTQADAISGGGGTDTVEFSSAHASYSLSRSGTTVWVTDPSTGITDTLTGITELQFSDEDIATSSIACFAEGTRIATSEGPCAVERLRVGTRVRTRSGEAEIIWLGHRRLACARHPRPWDVAPVHIRPNAFAPGTPAADLWLSPDHAVFADGILVPVRYLLNGRTIVQEDHTTITYWHVELARHDVLLAEGLPCESYLDTGNRSSFVESSGPLALHPAFAPRDNALDVWRRSSCAPLVRSGAPLLALRARLLERAETLGHARTADPGLELVVDGVVLEPQIYGETLHLALPDGADHLVLRSRVFRPAETRATKSDTRCLGVALAALALDETPLALDDPRLHAGWHTPEAAWRWSNGAGCIDVRGVSLISLRLASAEGLYWRTA